MELYKFIDENKIKKYKGGFVIVNNRIYTNPTKKTLKAAGYKQLVDAPIPEYNPDTQYLSVSYSDGEDIVKIYSVTDIETD